MRERIEAELKGLRQDLLTMAGLAEEAIGKAVKSLVARDPKLAEGVIQADKSIDQLEIAIDERCLKLLALYQPEAVDLRFIAMAFKLNNDLERVGDLAVNIAERVLDLIKEPPLKPLVNLTRMADLAQGMFKDSLDAFVRKDAGLARQVCLRDREVDELDHQIFRALLTYMLEDSKTITRSLSLILVSRQVERVADHATNIAEDVIYLVQGKSIKHHTKDLVAPPP
ncbi:MAG: phosphate signaling complex protein PhoU [Candidatus Omnitrophica bacterium]|nr:phosphate signaling complex protein PhoU [Candidatus Omnitrophota bacterium]